MILEARTLLQDKIPTSGSKLRYSDAEMFEAVNRMMLQIRSKRPDLFLAPFGARSLRRGMPYYNAANDMDTPFPLDLSMYSAFVYYLVGAAEMREDTFTESGRAMQMLARAVAQITGVEPPPGQSR